MPVFADYNRTVIGYHGTTRDIAEEVVLGRKQLVQTTTSEAWQGHGIYFWEHAPLQAWKWAHARHGGPAKNVAVVASMIRLGNCLDLIDPNNAHKLVEIHEIMKKRYAIQGKPLPRNAQGRKFLDCAVLEYAYALIGEEESVAIDTCRAVYVPSTPRRIWRSSWLCFDTHIQLCVRNPKCILGTWLVPEKPDELSKNDLATSLDSQEA